MFRVHMEDWEGPLDDLSPILILNTAAFLITFGLGIISSLITMIGAFDGWSCTGPVAACGISLMAVAFITAITATLSDVDIPYNRCKSEFIIEWVFSFGWASSSIEVASVITLVSGAMLKMIDLPSTGNTLLLTGISLFAVFFIISIILAVKAIIYLKSRKNPETAPENT